VSEIDRRKLDAVLVLLGSDRPGERDAAALAAACMVKSSGLSWEQVLTAPASAANDHHRVDANLPDLILIKRVEARRELLNEWERIFLDSIAKLLARGYSLTPRQRSKLHELPGMSNQVLRWCSDGRSRL